MVFLLGINFPDRWLVRQALTSLYGISANSATFGARAPASPPLSAFKNLSISGGSISSSSSGSSNNSSSSSRTSAPVPSTSASQSQTKITSQSQSQGSFQGQSATSSTTRARAGTNEIAATIAEAAASSPPVLSKQRYCQLSRLMAQHHIHATARLSELSLNDLNALTASLTNLTIENELKRQVRQNILRLRDMGSYRGRRHTLNLPVRGQRTRSQITNARKFNRVDWRN